MSLKDLPRASELNSSHAISVAAPDVAAGRRRPGRPGQISPHLLPLLRNPADAELSVPLPNIAEAKSANEDLSIARGFAVGMLLAVPAWAIIGLVMWSVMR